MNVRAKFIVDEVTEDRHFPPGCKNVVLRAVCDDDTPENERFSRYTPTGELNMVVNNPTAAAVFTPGREFYMDFTPCEPEAVEPESPASDRPQHSDID